MSKRFSGTQAGHDVELEFDQKRVVINEAILHVDGEPVDRTKVFYGDKELRTTLDDGTDIAVTIHSGMMGELTRAQLKRHDGSWVDLTPSGA
jgi:hypothetical protein